MKKLLTALLLTAIVSVTVCAEQQEDFSIDGEWYITSSFQEMNYSITKDDEGNYYATEGNRYAEYHTDGRIVFKDLGGVKLKKSKAKPHSFQIMPFSCILKEQMDFMNTGFMAI